MTIVKRILVAEDDPDDFLLLKDSFSTGNIHNPVDWVENGEDLIEFLQGKGRHTKRQLPDLIILDLNMPKKDGKQALLEIKSDPNLKTIPILVFTTSSDKEDVKLSYKLGANGFIVKPLSVSELDRITVSIEDFWLKTVSLP